MVHSTSVQIFTSTDSSGGGMDSAPPLITSSVMPVAFARRRKAPCMARLGSTAISREPTGR